MIRDIFPWAAFALHAALLVGVSLFMGAAESEDATRLDAVNAELAAYAWSKDMTQGKLDEEKKALEERTKVFAGFRGGRVAWTVPLHTIAASVPAGTVITSLTGDAEVETGARAGPGRTKKQLVVGFETPMAEDGTLPHEIDGFLASLRSEASIKQHFPMIEVSGLRANPVKPNSPPSASYSIVALPRSEDTKKQAKR